MKYRSSRSSGRVLSYIASSSSIPHPRFMEIELDRNDLEEDLANIMRLELEELELEDKEVEIARRKIELKEARKKLSYLYEKNRKS